ncbi:response regulator [Candidatus Acetothermia bacterium]|nr:response regulator [Candidatus Acetothermia bacterium]MBI3643136.1 response regulator [Candidatus Acetothermia bacterium]
MKRIPKGLDDLTTQYLQEIQTTLRELRSHLAILELDPSESGSLHAVRVEAHRLKGSGGSYGFPTISTLAAQMEEISGTALINNLPLSDEKLQRIELLLTDLEQEIVSSQLYQIQARKQTQNSEKPDSRGFDSTEELQILIVDSDPQIHVLTQRILTKHRNCKVSGCTNDNETLTFLASNRPDAILLDVSLPEMKGHALTRLIRQNPLTQETPIIFLSTESELIDIVEAIRNGADDVLIKPFDKKMLLDKIDNIVAEARPQHLRVAMVDDDPDLHKIIDFELSRTGYHVHVLQDPAKTLEMLSEIMPDLLLLDFDMPNLNGVEVCRAIRTDARFRALPIVFLSSRSDEETTVAGLRAGADDYITKPFRPQELVARIQARVQRNDLLSEQAHRDGLTQLYHNQYFRKYLHDTIERSKRYNESFCLVMLDFDNFKSVNDRHGHLTGDRVIQELAKFLRLRVRHSDLVARYGGDEFAIILGRISPQDCHELFGLLKDEFKNQKFYSYLSGQAFEVTLSAGITRFPDGDSGSADLIRKADQGLYQAKLAGKDRVHLNLPVPHD